MSPQVLEVVGIELWDIKRDTDRPCPLEYTLRDTASRRMRLAKMGVTTDVDGARLLSLWLRRGPCAARGGLLRVLQARASVSSTKRPPEPSTASGVLLAALTPPAVWRLVTVPGAAVLAVVELHCHLVLLAPALALALGCRVLGRSVRLEPRGGLLDLCLDAGEVHPAQSHHDFMPVQGGFQRDLAAMAEMSPTTLNRLEQGLQSVYAERLATLARILDVSADYLLGLPAREESNASSTASAHAETQSRIPQPTKRWGARKAVPMAWEVAKSLMLSELAPQTAMAPETSTLTPSHNHPLPHSPRQSSYSLLYCTNFLTAEYARSTSNDAPFLPRWLTAMLTATRVEPGKLPWTI